MPGPGSQETGHEAGAHLSPGVPCSMTALCWRSRGPWASTTVTPHPTLPALASSSGGALGTRSKMQGEEGVAPGVGWMELSGGTGRQAEAQPGTSLQRKLAWGGVGGLAGAGWGRGLGVTASSHPQECHHLPILSQ